MNRNIRTLSHYHTNANTDAHAHTKQIFLINIEAIDKSISEYMKSENLEMCYDEYANEYKTFKKALSCAILFSNYTINNGNMLSFTASDNILFNSSTLLSFCKSEEDLNYLKLFINNSLDSYRKLKDSDFCGNHMLLSVNPFEYKSIDETINFLIENQSVNVDIDIELDPIIVILKKSLNVLDNVKL